LDFNIDGPRVRGSGWARYVGDCKRRRLLPGDCRGNLHQSVTRQEMLKQLQKSRTWNILCPILRVQKPRGAIHHVWPGAIHHVWPGAMHHGHAFWNTRF